VEHRGEVWVASDDYKSEPDPTCSELEAVRCDTFVTESTFGLPIYRWSPQDEVFDAIQSWWRANREAGRASVLFGYALGKAQRLLGGLLGRHEGPILTHGAVERLNVDCRESGVKLPETAYALGAGARADAPGALAVAAAIGRRFGVAPSLRRGFDRLRVWMDAGQGHPAATLGGSGIRRIRSCRLAGAACGHRGGGSEPGLGDTRFHRVRRRAARAWRSSFRNR
jgi:Cft2 family RNA processing exonuclease